VLHKINNLAQPFKTVTIRRSAYRGAIDETKTSSSNTKLPLAALLAELVLAWQAQSPPCGCFTNPATGRPYMSPSLQQRWIRSAVEAIGVEGLGFHSPRHSYRCWLDTTGAAPGVTKDLMVTQLLNGFEGKLDLVQMGETC